MPKSNQRRKNGKTKSGKANKLGFYSAISDEETEYALFWKKLSLARKKKDRHLILDLMNQAMKKSYAESFLFDINRVFNPVGCNVVYEEGVLWLCDCPNKGDRICLAAESIDKVIEEYLLLHGDFQQEPSSDQAHPLVDPFLEVILTE